MPTKRSLWAKVVINFNYLINIIHLQASRVIPPPGPRGRPLKNVTAQIPLNVRVIDIIE